MRPILDETKHPKNAEKHKKEMFAKINSLFIVKNDEPINDKECQKIIDNTEFIIDDRRYYIVVNIQKHGIVNIFDKEKK